MKRLDARFLVPIAGLILLAILAGRNSMPRDDMEPFAGKGMPMPPLMAAGWINGGPPVEKQLDGHVVVIDCWATWCGECRHAAPYLAEAYRHYEPQGVQFIGLTPQPVEELDDIEQFVELHGTRWPIGYGALHPLKALGVDSFPTLLIVGRNGQIAQGFVGWGDAAGERVNAAIEAALGSH